MDIVSIATIEMQAVDAADAGKTLDEACCWPPGTEAAELFQAKYHKRMQQLERLKEVA